MITIIDVIRALSGLIETVTGDPPTTKDVTEGFERPCTWIRPLDTQPEAARGLRRDSIEIEIVYFAAKSWRGWKELLQVQEALAAALTLPVAVTPTFFVYPEDLDFVPSREDMTLSCTFNLENYQLIDSGSDAGAPAMEHLDLTAEDPDDDIYGVAQYGETEITIKGKSSVTEYTGNEMSVNGYTVSDYDAAITLTGPAQDSAKATAKGTEVGTYAMPLAASDFTAVSPKYAKITITVVPGVLEITEPETPEE